MHRHLIHRKSTQWVILLMVSLLAGQLYFHASVALGADKNPVKPPKTRMSAGVPIETESPEAKGWFSRNKWWVALGVMVLGGGVAAAIGAGSDESSEDTGPGRYTLEW